jgi:hypothetical protein
MLTRSPIARVLPALALMAVSTHQAAAVSVTAGTVNGLAANIWTWTDAAGHPRTVALKLEGQGNPGHGGYAIQFTYMVGTSTVTINAESSSDGGFGYFVSHERYRSFADGTVDTIAGHIFGTDDSPLGLGFAASMSSPAAPAHAGAQRFVIKYGHYGTVVADPVDPNSGNDSNPLPAGKSHYAFYSMPATTTWVFQDGTNYPRIDVGVSLAGVIPPGGSSPTADLVSFDMRGPYGVMVFDNGADGTVNSVLWGDQEYIFKLLQTPVTRDSTWTWNTVNKGARYQALQAGAFEMGMFEPARVSASATVDGYSAERGYTSASYAHAGGQSFSACSSGARQVLPSDGEWPYQSVQYSLPCNAGGFKTPTDFKKFAWGTTAYYGTSLTGVYNGRKSFAFNGFPASHTVGYSVCLVLGEFTAGTSLTSAAAATYVKASPKSSCATAAVN